MSDGSMNGRELRDHSERLAWLEERVFENHTKSIEDIRERIGAIDKKVWGIMLLLAANLGTGIMGLLK